MIYVLSLISSCLQNVSRIHQVFRYGRVPFLILPLTLALYRDASAKCDFVFGRGFYGGADAGYTVAKGSIRAISQNTNLIVFGTRTGGDGAEFGIFGGWSYQSGPLFVGFEPSYHRDTTDFQAAIYRDPVVDVQDEIRIRHKDRWGLALRVGFVTQGNTLFFAQFGVEQTRWDAKVIDTDQAAVPPITTIFPFNKSTTIFVPGVGIEAKLTNRIALRGTWRYAFPARSHLGLPTTIAPSKFENTRVSTSFSQSIFSLGFVVSII